MKIALKILAFALGIAACAALFAWGILSVRADITTVQPVQTGKFQTYTFFATSTVQTSFSTTTSATSTSITGWTNSQGQLDTGKFIVAGAKRVEFYFKRTGVNGNQGSSIFYVEVSPDGTNWYPYNKLYLNGATSTPTAMERVVLTGTTTQIAAMDVFRDTFMAVRCKVVEVTDGEHSCSASADF